MPAPRTILLIEDDDIDYELTRHAAESAGLDESLVRVDSGEAAIDLLMRTPADERPQLLLLDLRLTGMDGPEVLTKIKAEPELCLIPVVMLTSSDNPGDIERCYAAGAAAYVKKPIGIDGLEQLFSSIRSFWHGNVYFAA